MSGDDESRFLPKPGRIRSDVPKAGKAKSFLTQAKKLARQHSNSPSRSSSFASRTSSSPSSGSAGKSGNASRAGKGPGVKRGRGAAFVRARTLSGGWRHSAAGVERVDDGEGFCAEGEEDMSLRRVSYGQRVRKGTDARADSQSPASDEEGAGWL